MLVLDVSVERLSALCDPMKNPPWYGCACMSPDHVQACLSAGFLRSSPVDFGRGSLPDHAGRIAWLFLNPDPTPIRIDMGTESAPCVWPVRDGNHRLYAAMMRGSKIISAEILGDVDFARKVLQAQSTHVAA